MHVEALVCCMAPREWQHCAADDWQDVVLILKTKNSGSAVDGSLFRCTITRRLQSNPQWLEGNRRRLDGCWRKTDGVWGVTDGVTDGSWRVTDGGWRVSRQHWWTTLLNQNKKSRPLKNLPMTDCMRPTTFCTFGPMSRAALDLRPTEGRGGRPSYSTTVNCHQLNTATPDGSPTAVSWPTATRQSSRTVRGGQQNKSSGGHQDRSAHWSQDTSPMRCAPLCLLPLGPMGLLLSHSLTCHGQCQGQSREAPYRCISRNPRSGRKERCLAKASFPHPRLLDLLPVPTWPHTCIPQVLRPPPSPHTSCIQRKRAHSPRSRTSGEIWRCTNG